MRITFYKYEGAGNDFIIIDNRNKKLKENNYALWAKLCDRRFGIGADGLMLLQNKKGYDFEMYYVNADGKPTSMCGNGGRCIAHFAKSIGAIKSNSTHFIAIDGEHEATIKGNIVKLKMKDVNAIETEFEVKAEMGRSAKGTPFPLATTPEVASAAQRVRATRDYCIVNTGSPHYVTFVKDAMKTDVYTEGKNIRNSKRFKKEGINVNFVQVQKGKPALMRTYERGVEDETLACGTGTVATALVLASKGLATAKNYCNIKTRGGNLKVWFKMGSKSKFTDVYLEGPATFVYSGEIEI
jgi:diaminopimelate epimerase